MADVLGLVTWPGKILLAFRQRCADRVERLHEGRIRSHPIQDFLSDPGHDPHRCDDISAICDLDTEHRILRLERSHAERDDIHGPATHRSAIESTHRRFHLIGRNPIVGGSRIGFVYGADIGAILDACDIIGVRSAPKGVRLLLQRYEGAMCDELIGD